MPAGGPAASLRPSASVTQRAKPSCGSIRASQPKTVTVSLTRRFAHGLYGKQVVRTKKVHAHDEQGAKTGDTVRIEETRPLSRTKRWRVVAILERAR